MALDDLFKYFDEPEKEDNSYSSLESLFDEPEEPRGLLFSEDDAELTQKPYDYEPTISGESKTTLGYRDEAGFSEGKPLNIIGGLSDIGKLIYDSPTQVMGAIGNLMEDEDPLAEYDWKDKARDAAEARKKHRKGELTDKELEQKFLPFITRGDILDTSASTGFSGTSMLAGAPGAAIGLLPLPGARPASVVAAGALGGAAAYKMDKTSFTIDLIKATEDAIGRDLTDTERTDLLKETEDVRSNHALWEAGPEAVGNAIQYTGIGKIFGLDKAGKMFATRVAKGLASMYGGELATETVTQMGQQRAEVLAGMSKEQPRSWTELEDWLQSGKEVAPTTFLLTSLMGGGAAVTSKTLDITAEFFNKKAEELETKEDRSVDDIIKADNLRKNADNISGEQKPVTETLPETTGEDVPMPETVDEVTAEERTDIPAEPVVTEPETVEGVEQTPPVTEPVETAEETAPKPEEKIEEKTTDFLEKANQEIEETGTFDKESRKDAIAKYDEENGTNLSRQLHRNSIRIVRSKVKNGKPLTETQQHIYNFLEQEGGVQEKQENIKDEQAEKIDKTTPEKLAEAVGKPDEVETLRKGGFLDEEGQIEQIVRDAVTQKLDVAEQLEKKGHTEAANRIRNEAVENGKKLKDADGSLTEQKVDEALSGVEQKKEPWQQTQGEFVQSETAKMDGLPGFDSQAFAKNEAPARHKAQVKRAIKEGKFVPKEVLEQYPDLVPAEQIQEKPDGTKRPVSDNRVEPTTTDSGNNEGARDTVPVLDELDELVQKTLRGNEGKVKIKRKIAQLRNAQKSLASQEQTPEVVQRTKAVEETITKLEGILNKMPETGGSVIDEIRQVLEPEKAAAVTGLLKARAKAVGKTVEQYVNDRGIYVDKTNKSGKRGLRQTDKAEVQMWEDELAIISAFNEADVSSLAHELAHIFRRELSGKDLATLEEWAGVKDGNWTVAAEEKFARAFERYLAEGKAPNAELSKIFKKFKDWMLGIYKNIKGSQIDINISPEVEAVFGRMLSEEKPVAKKRKQKRTDTGETLKQSEKDENYLDLREAINEDESKRDSHRVDTAVITEEFRNDPKNESGFQALAEVYEPVGYGGRYFSPRVKPSIQSAFQGATKAFGAQAEVFQSVDGSNVVPQAVVDLDGKIVYHNNEIGFHPVATVGYSIPVLFRSSPSLKKIVKPIFQKGRTNQKALEYYRRKVFQAKQYKGKWATIDEVPNIAIAEMMASEHLANLMHSETFRKELREKVPQLAKFIDELAKDLPAKPKMYRPEHEVLLKDYAKSASEMIDAIAEALNEDIGDTLKQTAEEFNTTPEQLQKEFDETKAKYEASGININDSSQPFTEQILSGDKTIETRDTPSLRSYVGKRIGIVRTGKGKAQLVGYATISEEKVYNSSEEFRADDDKHLVDEGSQYDIKDKKYGYVLADVESVTPVDVDSKGIVSRKISQIGTAPNGKPSNLNDHLWVLVRTPRFKKWFGDWENDPANASKVVDENGEPKILTHGTRADWSEVDMKEVEFGLHLASSTGLSSSMAWGEGGQVYQLFANLKNPIRLVDPGSWGFDAVLKQLVELDVITPEERSAIQAKVNKQFRSGVNEIGWIDKITRNLLEDKGYDGVVYMNRRESKDGGTIRQIAKDKFGSWSDVETILEDYTDEDLREELGDVFDESYIAFSPNQIKSIFNTGEFGESGEILKQSDYTEQQLEAIDRIFGKKEKRSLKEMFDAFRYLAARVLRQGIVDRYDSIKNILKDDVAWMMAHLTHADTGALWAAIKYGRLKLDESGAIDLIEGSKGLMDVLKPLGKEVDRFLYWMAANRAGELTQLEREALFSDQDIAELKKLNEGQMKGGKNRTEVYETARKELQRMNNDAAKIAVKTGLISAEDAAKWKKMGFYIPFYRMVEENDMSKVQGPMPFGQLVNQRAGYEILGGKDPLADMLTNVLMNWNMLIGNGLRNQAGMKALESAVEMGVAEPVDAADRSESAVFVLNEGEKMWFEIANTKEGKLVLQSLLQLNQVGLNNIAMKTLRMFKSMLTAGVTASPHFMIANLTRDSLHASAVTNASPFFPKNLFTGAMGGVTGKTKRMQAGGGAFSQSGYIHGADPRAIKHLVGAGTGRNTIITGLGGLKKLWDAYGRAGAMMENVNRVAGFQEDLKKGKSLLEANFNSRDQLDFSRTGAFPAVRVLSQVIPFLNARLQGLDKMTRAGMDKKQMAQFYGVIGTYALASVMLYLAFKDDDDIDKAEEWEKRTYHMFKVPGEEDKIYRIPRPFEVGAVAYLAEKMTQQFVDDNAKVGDMTSAIGHTLSDTFAFNPIPQMAKPLVEVINNKSYFSGRPIENMSLQNQGKPESRYNPWTSEVAKYASKAMSEVFPRSAQLSPVQIEHLVRGYTGWVGSTVMASVDGLIRHAQGKKMPSKKWFEQEYFPFKRNVRMAEGKTNKYVTEFYDTQQEINEAYNSIKFYRDNDMEKEAEAEEEKYEELLGQRSYSKRKKTNRGISYQNKKDFDKASSEMSRIRKEIKKVYDDKTLTVKQKRQLIDDLKEEINQLAEDTVEQTK